MIVSKKELMQKFRSRLVTQDREGRLPMRVINGLLSKNKEWKDIINDTIYNIRFLIGDDANNFMVLKDINRIEFDISNNKVCVVGENNESHILYTEVFNRKTQGCSFVELEASKMRELSLDHPIPIACLFEVNELPNLKQLNGDYADFVSDNDFDSISKRASAFLETYSKKYNEHFIQELLNELRKVFLKSEPLTIMRLKDNISKNAHFFYCSRYLTCPDSEIKTLIKKFKEVD